MRLIDADYICKGLFNDGQNFDRVHGNIDFICGIETALELIHDAPTIDAEPVVHAHWHHGRICSNCGAPIPTDSAVDYLDENDNSYCYGCGAKMDEEG